MHYVLIPGAACTSWHWHPVTDELRRRGHTVTPVDLPCDDPTAGLEQYVDTVVGAVPHGEEVVLAAHSLGGFTGVMACERLPVREFVLVAAMVPAPGERISELTQERLGFRPDEMAGAHFPMLGHSVALVEYLLS
ncbi:alpha/beta fold hydrolase [Kribbella sp. NBC_00889]|uniref:alpha/beta fold hydrolase n=1 Tax=Kribbella sp. NBC_00889 TaxID=2975974 RepID=UPI00386C8199|nr:alpha/beta fold hydrolase [Kribbella sp. NBC_00889]